MKLSMYARALWILGFTAMAVGCHESTTTSDPAGGGQFYVAPTADASGAGPVECASANECGGGSLGPCDRAACIDGKCVVEQKEPGQSCVDATLTPGECQTTRCDSAGECVVSGASDGTRCGILDACQQQTCEQGKCNGPVAKTNCDDNNPCTTDTCDPNKGCSSAASTTACDDGDACTKDDSCKTGVCAGTPDCECKADADCAALDTDKCDGKSTCVAGKCVTDTATAVKCTLPAGAKPCETAACDPATGKCSTAVVEYTPCDDTIACTKDDYCTAAGACISKKFSCEFDCTDAKDEDGDLKTDCADSDCASDAACAAAPSCTDKTLNGTESDVDCGGTCPKCETNLKCGTNADCMSNTCESNKCVPP